MLESRLEPVYSPQDRLKPGLQPLRPTLLGQSLSAAQEKASAGQDSPSESVWGHPRSEAEVYLLPYTGGGVGHLLVAEEAGRLVGYLAGATDSSGFPSEEERLTDRVSAAQGALWTMATKYPANTVSGDAIRIWIPVSALHTGPRWLSTTRR